MTQLERVLKLADKGFRLFPLSPGSKMPLKGTNGVLDATSNKAQLEHWYKENPASNWGIAGGMIDNNDADYLIVIDVDTKEGKDGAIEFHDIIAKYGAPPETLKIRTCSGGWHYYFLTKIKKNRYNARFKGAKHIDIKAAGGYLVLWGSSTPDGKYTVESGHVNNICYLEDWLKEDTEDCISSKTESKDYERKGIIGENDGRWLYLSSQAGKLRSRGLKDTLLEQALLDIAKEKIEGFPGGKYNEEYIRKLAESYSNYEENYSPTDQGNAERFIAVYGRDVKHSTQLGWFVWNGKQWARDMGEKTILHYAGQLVHIVNDEILSCESEEYKKVLKRTRQMLSMNTSRKNALSIAKATPDIDIEPDAFDKEAYLFNMENGVVDLKTGKIRKHSPDLLQSKISPTTYDREAKAPLFKKFLSEITCNDSALEEWLQTYFGYSMTANVQEQLFSVFYGTGGNGKSVLVNVISTIMGQYTLETPVETIMYKHGGAGASNDIARIKGSRLVTCRESDQGNALAESLIKSLTGGDKIAARFLHKEFFEFKPVAKWILFTNHKPTIRGTDQGIWRRVKLVPFNYRVPEGSRNKNLEPELLIEAPGIMNWLVEGCIKWQKQGFPKCDAIDNATNEYKQDEDRLGEFLSDAVDTGPDMKVSASELYKAYRWFCKDAGDMALSSRNFPKKLEEKGYMKKRVSSGNMWFGFDLTEEYRTNIYDFDNRSVNF